jgi:hypothetical protein
VILKEDTDVREEYRVYAYNKQHIWALQMEHPSYTVTTKMAHQMLSCRITRVYTIWTGHPCVIIIMKQRQLGDHGGSRETSQPEVTP